jgi:Tfp pilus assembly protein PilV
MVRRNFLLAILVIVLVFGMTVSGCAALAGAAITEATQSSQNKKVNNAVSHAISEIEKVLPDNATVWINKGAAGAGYNVNSLGIATSTAGAVDTAVDDITSAFIQKGIRLVDRQNAALVQAEQKFQSGGNVSEQEMVSIGKAAGANTLVTVSVVPQGRKQRLQIRVIDIERGIPLMQTSSGEEWTL